MSRPSWQNSTQSFVAGPSIFAQSSPKKPLASSMRGCSTRPSAIPNACIPTNRQAGNDANIGMHAFRSEEHTSELQSHLNLVCRLLLEKKKKTNREGASVEN